MTYRYSEADFESLQRRLAKQHGVVLPKKSKPVSKIEEQFAEQLKSLDFPEPVRNYKAITGRKFEFDFCWPSRRFAVEIQGNAHRIKSKFKADIEKRYLAQKAGWRVLEVGGDEVRSGEAIAWLETLWGYREISESVKRDMEERN